MRIPILPDLRGFSGSHRLSNLQHQTLVQLRHQVDPATAIQTLAMPLVLPNMLRKSTDKPDDAHERRTNTATSLGDADVHGGTLKATEQSGGEGDVTQGSSTVGEAKRAGIVPPFLASRIKEYKTKEIEKEEGKEKDQGDQKRSGPSRPSGFIPPYLLEHIAASEEAPPEEREAAAGTLRVTKKMHGE